MKALEVEKDWNAQEASGTCAHCGKLVASGESLFSITGAHWDCHDGKVTSALARETPRLEVCRAGSGTTLHIVDRKTGTALCGFRPRNRAWQMRKRGGWHPVQHEAATCPECIRAHGSATVDTGSPGEVNEH